MGKTAAGALASRRLSPRALAWLALVAALAIVVMIALDVLGVEWRALL